MEPKYDEDTVNLGYLNKTIKNAEQNINKEYENVSRHYASKPQPPYYKGDTWIDGYTVYTCINTRVIGTYTDSDWTTESGAKAEAEDKNKIYLTQPTNYKIGDMWILQTDDDHKAGKKGEILITTATRNNYNANDWVNMLSYGTIKSINEVSNNLNEAIDEICKYADNKTEQKIFAFIDEIDSFATEDNTSNVRYNAGVLNTLKKCLSEKLMTRDNVIIMAATNNDISSKSGNFSLPILDRFDQRIKVDNPSKSQIAKAISLHYKDKPQVAQYLKDETSKEVQEIAQELSNQNGSFRTLETVYNIAATVNKESNTLTFDDVLDAIKQMRFEEGNIRKTKIGFNS